MKTKNFFEQENQQEKRAEAGAARYRLLRTAQGILAKAGLDWKEQHRTCWCSRSLKRGSETVDVLRNANRDGAAFAGLNRCGNLHTCPVCAAKVAELRRKQLSAAMVKHVGNGGGAYLLTFTFPHEADEALDTLMAKFDKARQRFQNSRIWKDWKKRRACIGVVNSLEFTVSTENGWHPHVHMLAFADRQAFDEGQQNELGDLDSNMIQDLQRKWVEVLFKVGLGDHTKLNDMLAHALNVRGGEKAAEYIAKFGRDEKWGASSELARSHAKIGAAGEKWGVLHFTPFQLLLWAEEGDGWAVHRFREYAEATEGKRALVWSPDLKGKLGVLDVNEDEWIAQDEPAPEQVHVGTITSEQYATLLSRKHVPQFLHYVATCADSQDDLDDYIESMKGLDKIASGSVLVPRFMGGGRSVVYA
jgi:hypothetical protein